MKEETKWINCAKAVAILAVVVDHLYPTLYANETLHNGTLFSVCLFILISGYNSFFSNERHGFSWLKTFVRSSGKLVEAYLIATMLYLFIYWQSFNLPVYLKTVIGFSASPPYYYVLVFIQLMIINKPMYNLIKSIPKKCQLLLEILLGVSVFLISVFLSNNTFIADVYGGGRRLFGGTYMFLFYIGMILAKHRVFHKMSVCRYIVVSVVSVLLYFCSCWLVCIDQFKYDSRFLVDGGANPPGLILSIMALAVLFAVFGVCSLFQTIKIPRGVVNLINYLGKHTTYVFLYHKFVLDLCCDVVNESFGLLRGVLLLVLMIVIPIVIELVITFLGKLFRGDFVLSANC